MKEASEHQLSQAELLELQRWNTPSVYNGWEQITKSDAGKDGFNLEECRDFMPEMGPMVGYAVTVVVEPSNPEHRKQNPKAWSEYRRYVASLSGPKIAVVQDLNKPETIGSFWGEVNSSIHRALGCVGTITDGAIRDLDEMRTVGYKAIARRLCVGHAYSHPVRWNCPVEVFGRSVEPGELIHADKHGFLVVPQEDRRRLLDATRFMDSNECRTMISAARQSCGVPLEQLLARIDDACDEFSKRARTKFMQKQE
ncbi:MAG: dimethylmenaquinone methyltransferase [Planctomycetes bacterium B3_Pla]|nr:MAG: dimethylmenaquinone methyltransferase [Planctomycetes bacterium B3_Pla]